MSENYSLKAGHLDRMTAPELPYHPPRPKHYRPGIGLIGCGGIVDYHLRAAQALGVEVVAFYNPTKEKALLRRDEFFPNGTVCESAEELLARSDVEVVDIATHANVRGPLIEAALRAGKHVLSQKPFALDLAEGRRLVALAEELGLRLAVNQNGRWAPYFSYLQQAVNAGLLGEVQTLELAMNWDHSWIKGTAFEHMPHIIVNDFAIHWIDIAACVFAGRKIEQVFATEKKVPNQQIEQPMTTSIIIQFEDGLATLFFNAQSRFGAQEHVIAVGSEGTLRGAGPLCGIETLSLFTSGGESEVKLEGSWFPDGFTGALGELLCAIEEGREPCHSAANNLRSLEIAFAAIRSVETGLPQK